MLREILKLDSPVLLLAALPAMKSEQGREAVEVAREESVSFLASWGPKRVIVRDGRAAGIELVRCTRVFDDAGRFKPEFDESQRRTLEADTIILAIGQAPDFSFLKPEDGVETTPAGSLKIDPATLATNIPGVFSGGRCGVPALAAHYLRPTGQARRAIDRRLPPPRNHRAARDAGHRRGASD